MKSYGRAPTFLMATGYEQVRSIAAAALAGDFDAADDVQLDLPETGVCGSTLAAEAASRDIAARFNLEADVPAKLAAATMALLPTSASTGDAVRAAATQIGLDTEVALQIAALTNSPAPAQRGQADQPRPRRRWRLLLVTTPTTQHTAPASEITGGCRRTTLVASLAIRQTIGYNLWENPTIRKRFALRWRTPAGVHDVAHDLSWTVAASLNKIIPMEDLGDTIQAAVLYELVDWQRTHGVEEGPHAYYPIARQVVHILDWLIRHQPNYAGTAVNDIVGEAYRQLNIDPAITGRSLQQSLAMDGKLDSAAYTKFLDTVLPPAN
jgi:hypothetical protein